MTPEKATAELTDEIGDYACVFWWGDKACVQLDGAYTIAELRKVIAKMRKVKS